MRRSDELAQLSREHHVGLEMALRLRRASEAEADELRVAFLDFFEAEAREHFRAEEEILLPAFARYCDDDDADVVRVLLEHLEIRRHAGNLANGSCGVTELRALGELLNAHIRHEERVLFPRVEQALNPDELQALRTALDGAVGSHERADG
jgi:hemerythrin-like domain-containing protein